MLCVPWRATVTSEDEVVLPALFKLLLHWSIHTGTPSSEASDVVQQFNAVLKLKSKNTNLYPIVRIKSNIVFRTISNRLAIDTDCYMTPPNPTV